MKKNKLVISVIALAMSLGISSCGNFTTIYTLDENGNLIVDNGTGNNDNNNNNTENNNNNENNNSGENGNTNTGGNENNNNNGNNENTGGNENNPNTPTETLVNIASVSLGIDNSILVVEVGQHYTFEPTVLPENATEGLSWASTDTSVCTIANGVLYAVATGSSFISAYASNHANVYDYCTVTVIPASSTPNPNPNTPGSNEDETFTVSWQAKNPASLDWEEVFSSEFKSGATPIYAGPSVASYIDGDYEYTFTGEWRDGTNNPIGPITGDIVYYARYSSKIRTYHVRWLDYDGSLLDEIDFAVNLNVTHIDNPTRDSTSEFNYEFDRWVLVSEDPSGDKVYQASYFEIPNDSKTYYKVDFYTLALDSKGVSYYENIYSEYMVENSTLTYNGPSFETELECGAFIYTFSNTWTLGDNTAVTSVTSNISVYALYNEERIEGLFEVWYYYANYLIEEYELLGFVVLHDGDSIGEPPYTPLPSYESEDKIYTFTDWFIDDTSYAPEVLYIAMYSSSDKPTNSYYVNFMICNGVIASEFYYQYTGGYYEEGSTPAIDVTNIPLNTTPGSGMSTIVYKIAGWKLDPDSPSYYTTIPDVTGAATYYAYYVEITDPSEYYIVSWITADSSQDAEYYMLKAAEIPSYPYGIPTKASDSEYSYTFSSWDKVTDFEDALGIGHIEYLAVFNSTPLGGGSSSNENQIVLDSSDSSNVSKQYSDGNYGTFTESDSGVTFGYYRAIGNYSSLFANLVKGYDTYQAAYGGAIYNTSAIKSIESIDITYNYTSSGSINAFVSYGQNNYDDHEVAIPYSSSSTSFTVNVTSNASYFKIYTTDASLNLRDVTINYSDSGSSYSFVSNNANEGEYRLARSKYSGSLIAGSTSVTVPISVEFTSSGYTVLESKTYTYYTLDYVSNHSECVNDAAMMTPMDVANYVTIFGKVPANYGNRSTTDHPINSMPLYSDVVSVFGNNRARYCFYYSGNSGYAQSVPANGNNGYWELDIAFSNSSYISNRGSGRIVVWLGGYSSYADYNYGNDIVCTYTDDHYATFQEFNNAGGFLPRFNAQYSTVTGARWSEPITSQVQLG